MRLIRLLFKTLLSLFSLLCILLFVIAWQDSTLQLPAPSYLLLDKEHQFLSQIRLDLEQEYGYWPLTQVPTRVAAATLALEDKRFWQHPGVDILAAMRAVVQNSLALKRVSGASTLAMQIARMQSNRPRTYWHKSIDALSALIMTYRYGRETLLKHYLTLVPYGNRIHGIRYAARLYFEKPVEDLSWAEIALLSAIPQAPGLMNVYQDKGLELAKQRGASALENLLAAGVIPPAEYKVAQQQLSTFKTLPKPTRPPSALHAILAIRQQLLNQKPATYLLQTSFDPTLQETVQQMVQQAQQSWQKTHAVEQIAVIIADAKRPRLLSWIGSVDFYNSHAGAIDYTQTPRSPGSTLKPFLYAQALTQRTILPNTLLGDLQINAWGFNNADRQFLGPLLPRQALANSRNIPAIHLLLQLGLQRHYEFLQLLGLHQHRHPAEYYGLGLALGNLPVTLYDLVTAYHNLANDGRLQKLSWHLPDASPKSVLPAHSARQITLFLSDPQARLPSFKRMGATEYPFPVAIKTGTSQNYRDAWSIAYSKDYLIGVWVGRPDAQPMKNFGGINSAYLAQKIMLHLHPEQSQGYADHTFPPPEGYIAQSICVLDGKYSQDCQRTLTEWFAEQDLPQLEQSFERYEIDTRNQLLATQWTPEIFRRPILWLKLSSRYQQWMAENHVPQKPTEYSPLDIPAHVQLQVPTQENLPSLQDAIPMAIEVLSPRTGSHIFRSPDTPAEQQSIALQASVSGNVEQVLWFVDGQPYQLCEAPFTVRWTLQPGKHTFRAQIPYTDIQSPVIKLDID